MKRFLSLVPLLIASFSIFAQNEDALLQFQAVQVDNKVQLDFVIKAGYTCNGIQIYRSSDSLNFIEIGDIQGICGSSDRNESYTFSDFSPEKNKNNYYRLQLGTLGNSFTIYLFFVSATDNMALVFPNPVTGESTVYFLNNAHAELQLTVFSCDRKLVYRSPATRGNTFRIASADFNPGIYFFEIRSDEKQRYKGEFIVR